MKQITSILLIFIALACKNKPKKTFVLPSDYEINSIVEAVIYQDSLPVLKDKHYKSKLIKFLAIDLTNLRIFFPDTTLNYPPPPDIGNISMRDLIRIQANEKPFFQDSDSSFIIYQTRHLKSFLLKNQMFTRLNLTTTKSEKENWRTGHMYFSSTIPVLSLDRKHAYVERDFHCTDCGGGNAIYLNKINNKWIIVDRRTTWQN